MVVMARTSMLPFSTTANGFTVPAAMSDATTDWYNDKNLITEWGVASPTINNGDWLHFTQMVLD